MNAAQSSKEDLRYIIGLVREQAHDFYLADLLLPDHVRSDILTLRAFQVEITNITLAVREPMASEIRLQWWADVIAGRREEEASGHTTARALIEVIERHNLPRQALDAKLEAHVFDLYCDPMGDRTMFEGWCGETRSILYQMAALVSGAEPSTALANASGHAGVASGVVSVLHNLARHRMNGRVFVPRDLLLAAGLTPEEFLTKPEESHLLTVDAMIDLGREHFVKAQSAVAALPGEMRSAFLSLALVPLYLDQAKKARMAIFSGLPEVSQLKRQWCLWRASRRGVK